MRRTFADALLAEAKKDKNIVLVTMDLGYKLWDEFRSELPDQFFNVGSSELAGMAIAVGMTLEGKTVFVYSITPFLLFRAAEVIRNYIDHEEIPVKMVGSGRDNDYSHDGFSHSANDDQDFLKDFPAIECLWPDTKEEIAGLVKEMIDTEMPYYINLKR